MNIRLRKRPAGLTLIEVMIAIGILALVVSAIYSTWTSILKATRVGLDAAAAAQRERLSMEVIEEALAYTQFSEANFRLYGFVAENGDEGRLSFVSHLPQSFPRSGKFPEDVRRVEFSVRPGRDGDRVLVVKQAAVLKDFDKDEEEHPVVLARNVKKLQFEFWNDRKGDWDDEWTQTNVLPKLVKANLVLGRSSPYSVGAPVSDLEITRVIAIHARGVPRNFQPTFGAPVPGMPGMPGMPVVPGMPGVPGAPPRPPVAPGRVGTF